MTIFLLVLWVLSLGIILLVQLRYASANYPRSWHWEFLLISTSFVSGCIMGAALFMRYYGSGTFVTSVITFGLTFVVVFRFFFLQRIRRVIPKRPPSADKDKDEE